MVVRCMAHRIPSVMGRLPSRQLPVLSLVLVIVLSLVQQVHALLQIERGPVVTVPQNGGWIGELTGGSEHQTLQKTWVVHMDPEHAAERIEEIQLAVPGLVVVTYSQPQFASAQPLASVRFSGDSQELLDMYDVSCNSNSVLAIRSRPDVKRKKVEAYLMIEIHVSHSAQLRRLSSEGSADVVVESHVIATDARSNRDTDKSGGIDIQISGSGSVLVRDRMASVDLTHLSLAVSGSGRLELALSVVQASSIDMAVSGSGGISVISDTMSTKDTEIGMRGSGSVCINARDFASTRITSVTAGSGAVSIASGGQCENEVIAVFGSGVVYTGSIICEQVKASIAGSGSIIVQATQALSGGVVGSGEISYVGAAPAQLPGKPHLTVFSSPSKPGSTPEPLAKPATENKQLTCQASAKPAHEPMRITVVVGGGAYGSSLGLHRNVLYPLAILAVVSLCFIRHETKKRYRQQATRGERQPLRSTAAQVYV